jgi:hypothetical protein
MPSFHQAWNSRTTDSRSPFAISETTPLRWRR